MKETFKVADIARILNVSEKYITNEIQRGRLIATKAAQWEITFKDATDYINLTVQERIKCLSR